MYNNQVERGSALPVPSFHTLILFYLCSNDIHHNIGTQTSQESNENGIQERTFEAGKRVNIKPCS